MSAAGALYYYLPPPRDRQHIQMATFDLASGTLRSPLANLPEEEEAEESLSPDWSPDGKALAYISKRHVGRGAECSIKIRSMHAGETREVRPQGHSFFYNLRWAPGGRSLLISAPEGLYRVDGQSGESSLLLKKIYGRFPQMQWEPSPDAKALYYSQRKSPNADTAFVELDLASGREREMIRRPTARIMRPRGDPPIHVRGSKSLPGFVAWLR